MHYIQEADLGEQGIEAVDFLPLFDICVELGDTFQREFIHEVDLEWLDHVSILRRSAGGENEGSIAH